MYFIQEEFISQNASLTVKKAYHLGQENNASFDGI